MRAKLIKVEDVYRLLREDNLIIGTTDYEYQKAFSDHCYKLSLKNCQAIENGYDLDKLADEYCTHEPKNAKELRDVNIVKLGFRDGFQKALEILGDKKFSEEDVLEISWELFRDNPNIKKFSDFKKCFEEHIQSLQQNEWEVEIVMESIGRVKLGIGSKTEQMMPKLDADGCIVLKRK